MKNQSNTCDAVIRSNVVIWVLELDFIKKCRWPLSSLQKELIRTFEARGGRRTHVRRHACIPSTVHVVCPNFGSAN